MNNLSFADSAVFVVLAAFFLRSLFRGAFRELVSLFSILAGYLSSFQFAPALGAALRPWLGGSSIVRSAVFTGIFVFVWLGVSLSGKILLRLMGKKQGGYANRIGGGIIGLGKGFLAIAAVYAVLLGLAPSFIPQAVENERVMPFVRRAGRFVRRISALELSAQADLIKGAIIPSSGCCGWKAGV